MPLTPASLASALEQRWLTRDGGSFPASVSASADAFASCVSEWFALAVANGVPCSTAAARKGQLVGQATGALAARSAQGAGSQLGSALAAYITAQSFGPGVAAAPVATAAAISEFVAVFSDLDSAPASKAQRLGAACHQLALSTLVTFPGAPPIVAPII